MGDATASANQFYRHQRYRRRHALAARGDMATARPAGVSARSCLLRCIGMHGAVHVFVLHVLGHLQERGVSAAERALLAYLERGRLSHLDLAIAWIGFALLASILGGLFPLALPAGG